MSLAIVWLLKGLKWNKNKMWGAKGNKSETWGSYSEIFKNKRCMCAKKFKIKEPKVIFIFIN